MKSSIIGIMFGVFIVFCSWLFLQTVEYPSITMPPSVSPSESNSKPMVFNDAQIALINKFTRISEKKKLTEWEQFYNFARPHGAHDGESPYESLRDNLG